MLSWLLYGIVIGSLLTVGAHGIERICQLTDRPTRWAWVGALILVVILVGAAPYRVDQPSNTALTSPTAMPTGADANSHQPTVRSDIARSFEVVSREVTSLVERAAAFSEMHLPVSTASLDRFLVLAWMALSTVVLLVFATAYLHMRRVRQQWPTYELHGARVRVTPSSGPAVVGLVHPEIVLPQWLLACPVEQQQAVLAHEDEHIRAGDPWLLAIACVIAALLAWHPAVWWMASRLRLAVELDCDARAIRHGFGPQIYGSILIDLTERCSGVPGSALALADKPSHLKRRLLAMKLRRQRFAPIHGGAMGVFALLSLLMACTAKLPAAKDSSVSASANGRLAPGEYHAPKQQQLALRLPDGTSVVLAPGSTLRVPSAFDQPNRTVELQGEAVFEVEHDSARPFRVRTSSDPEDKK